MARVIDTGGCILVDRLRGPLFTDYEDRPVDRRTDRKATVVAPRWVAEVLFRDH